MKYAKTTLGGADANVVTATVADATAISVIMAGTELAVLVADDVAATFRFVEIEETIRRAMQVLRESPTAQGTVNPANQHTTVELALADIKQNATVTVNVLQATLINVVCPAGSVAIILPESGGLTVMSRSAIEQCVQVLSELDFNPA